MYKIPPGGGGGSIASSRPINYPVSTVITGVAGNDYVIDNYVESAVI